MTDESCFIAQDGSNSGMKNEFKEIVRSIVREELRRWANATRDANLQEVRFLEKEFALGKEKSIAIK